MLEKNNLTNASRHLEFTHEVDQAHATFNGQPPVAVGVYDRAKDLGYAHAWAGKRAGQFLA